MVFAALIELLVRQRNERFAHGDRSLPKWIDQVSERAMENLELVMMELERDGLISVEWRRRR